MTAEQSQEAHRFLASARSDLSAGEFLGSSDEQGDDVVGFHCQQAIEKALKAVIVALGREIPYTHDLGFLIAVATEEAGSVPEQIAEADWLSPWAVAARYGIAVGSLDRSSAVTAAKAAVEWANRELEAHG